MKLGLMLTLGLVVGCGTQSTSLETSKPAPGAGPQASVNASGDAAKLQPESSPLAFRELEVEPLLVSLSAAEATEPMKVVLPWHRVLSDSLLAHNGLRGRATEAMRCLAAELARYVSQNNQLPRPSLQRYFEMQCGTFGVGTEVQFEVAEVSEPLPDPEQLWKFWGTTLKSVIEQTSRQGTKASNFGVSVYVASPRAVAVVVTQTIPLDLAVKPYHNEQGQGFILEGKFHSMMDGAAAVTTDGTLGYRACDVDTTRALPSFRFDCPQSGQAGTPATVEVFSRVPGRLVANLGARFQIANSRGEKVVPLRFLDLSKLGSSAEATSQPRWLSSLNSLRGKRDLRPLVFEPEQSRVIRKAMPSYLEALTAVDGASASEAQALAMLAGWHTSIPVIGGSMTTKMVESTDPDEWLSVVLTEPSARMVLMNPDASRIAASFLEVSSGGETGLTGLVVTYETLDLSFRDRAIASLREQWGFDATNPTGASVLAAQRSSLLGDAENGVLGRGELLESLLEVFSSETKCEVRTTIIETIDLSSVKKPLWLNKFEGQLMVDIAYLGRSSSDIRKLWIVVTGLPSTCRR